MNAAEALAKMVEKMNESAGIENTGSAETLKEFGKRYLDRKRFTPGDLVMWKPGMKNTKYPGYGKPAVVLEIFDGHRRTVEQGGTSYSEENAELRIGVLDNGGDLVGFWQDINRFEPYREQPAAEVAEQPEA